jgi:hypothetical protein
LASANRQIITAGERGACIADGEDGEGLESVLASLDAGQADSSENR